MIEQPDSERINKINKLAALLAVAQDNPSLQKHILSTDRERLLHELEMWYGLSENDIKESIGWLRKEGTPEGYWFWW